MASTLSKYLVLCPHDKHYGYCLVGFGRGSSYRAIGFDGITCRDGQSLEAIRQRSTKEFLAPDAHYLHDPPVIQKKILVPVDESQQFLRALNYAASIYGTQNESAMSYILNVIEWVTKMKNPSMR